MATSVGERITRLETEMNHVATKADVAAVRADIEGVRIAVQGVGTDIAYMQTSLVKWMTVAAVGIVLSIGLGIADLLVGVLAG